MFLLRSLYAPLLLIANRSFFLFWYQFLLSLIDQIIKLCLESGSGGCKEKIGYGGASWVRIQIHAASS